MQASIVDLRYKMADVLKALERNESVQITHRGRIKGVIHPAGQPKADELKDHPFFQLREADETAVNEAMNRLRGGRYNDL